MPDPTLKMKMNQITDSGTICYTSK